MLGLRCATQPLSLSRSLTRPDILGAKGHFSSGFSDRRPETLVVFDKDGTLKDFHTSWVPWLRSNAERVVPLVPPSTSPRPTVECVYGAVGYFPGRKRSLTSESPLTHASMTEIRDLVEERVGREAMEGWHEKICPKTVAFSPVVPHLQSSLHQLKKVGGVRMAVATSDTERNAEAAMRHFGVESLFDLVIGCDSPGYLHKPEKQILHRLCDQLSVPPERCIMVGDTQADMQMAKDAGAVGVGVLSGIGGEEELREAGANYVLDDVSELQTLYPTLLSSLDPPASFSLSPSSSSSSSLSFPFSKPSKTFGGLFSSPSSLSSRSFSTSTTQREKGADKGASLPSRRVIVVGAGSAGSIVSSRLAENENTEVLLLEAGPRDDRFFDWWRLSMPSAMGMNLQNKTFNWGFETTPQPHLNNRKVATPRGRVLGGSSSINAMVYLRGNKNDYDHWEQEGAKNWSYKDCLPFFKKLETYHPRPHAPSDFSPAEVASHEDFPLRGTNGPVHVSRPASDNPVFEAFCKAGEEAGYPRTIDFNGESQDGFGVFDANIFDGERMSASRCYLKAGSNKKNEQKEGRLIVQTGVNVVKVIMDGKRAVGVEYVGGGGGKKVEKVFADEVVLASGPVGSPSILQRSGIGNEEMLQKLGIETKHHLAGVGHNLQDHLEVYVQYKSKQPVGLFPYQWSKPHNMVAVGMEWFMRRTGICASNHLETGAFVQSGLEGVTYPDVQFHFLPAAIDDQGSSMKSFGHAFQVHVGPMRSASRGEIQITSMDPFQPPLINPNYMAHERDWVEFRRCVEIARDVFSQPAMKDFVDYEAVPGIEAQTDQEIDDFVKKYAESSYHLCGSCKMGSENDEFSVVDEHGRVRGVPGLYVIDSSIMPSVVTSNLNCPTMMIAEKMSHSLTKM